MAKGKKSKKDEKPQKKAKKAPSDKIKKASPSEQKSAQQISPDKAKQEKAEEQKPAPQTPEPESKAEPKPEQDSPAQKTSAPAASLIPREISQEMEESYLDYAMSVIVARALPDVRDGLKPVHRRILFAMHEMGLHATASFRKSAAVVGDVLGKYHPHGDTAVYDSLVRLAQDFSMRYPLVRGQGNFGSVDGDSAAAMRYTEAKLEKITDEILSDIDKETVDWQANYDGKFKEPKVLPSKIPQLLLNGSTGIAVGMATSIPPHNLGELMDGLLHLSDNPDATVEDLMQFVKGPDFPTGGVIYNVNAIKDAYTSGRGGIVCRAKATIEEQKSGRYEIVITEIPYMVNKATLVTRIAELVRDKKIVGITDLRDESNREGMRVVIELKKDSYPKKILNQLFKMTQLQETFNFNMIALVDGLQPRLLDLKLILEYFIKHRKEMIVNRTKFELKEAKAREHILEGLKKALDHIDEVIATIKASATKEDAQTALIKKFKLTEIQAQAILEMRLQTLAGLERKKIENELKEKRELIAELESILKDPKKVIAMMKKEFKEIRDKYADERKTEIIPTAVDAIDVKDTIPNEPMIVMVTRENYVKRMPPTNFRAQHRGGKGIIGLTTKEEDEIKLILYAKNHDEVMFFTSAGRCFKLPVYEIPQASRISKGSPLVNFLQLKDGEVVTAMFTITDHKEGKFLFMCTKNGTVKKTPIEDFKNVRRSGLIAIKIWPDDSLEWVRRTTGNDEVLIVTKNGQCIRFNEKDCRSMGRTSHGVRGIRLKEKDTVVEMDVVPNPSAAELLVVMENGLGKCSPVTMYRFQSRGGTGVKTANITEKTGRIIGAKIIQERTRGDLLLVSKQGQLIRMNLKTIPSQGRATQGVFLMRLNAPDKVASISVIFSEESEAETVTEQAEKLEQVRAREIKKEIKEVSAI